MDKLKVARRTVLKGALGTAAGAALSSVAWAQDRPASYADLPNLPGPGGLTMEDIRDRDVWPMPSLPPASGVIQTTQIADGAFVISGAGCNVLVVPTGGGAIVVDGGRVEHAQALHAAILALPRSGPIHTLFNTSWRPEYTGLNRIVGAAGGRIIAHLWAKQRQSVRTIHPWDPKNPHLALPVEARANSTFVVYSTSTANAAQDEEIAGIPVQYALMPQAHTDNSIYVYFPSLNVAAIGGVVNGMASSWEQTGDGYRGNWAEVDWWTGARHAGINSGLQIVEQRTNANTLIVPAQGMLMSRAELTPEVLEAGRIGALSLTEFLTERLLAPAMAALPAGRVSLERVRQSEVAVAQRPETQLLQAAQAELATQQAAQQALPNNQRATMNEVVAAAQAKVNEAQAALAATPEAQALAATRQAEQGPISRLTDALSDANLGFNLTALRNMHNSINSSLAINATNGGRDVRLAAFLTASNRQQYIRVLGNPTVFVYRAVESNTPFQDYPNN